MALGAPTKSIALRLGFIRAARTVVAGTVAAAMSAAIAFTSSMAAGTGVPSFTGDATYWFVSAVILGGALSGFDKFLREIGFYGKAG